MVTPLRRAAVAACLVAALLAPGCLLAEPDPARVIMGRVDGDSATNRYYKIFLTDAEGLGTIANFDRVDWYVAGVERAVSEKRVRETTVRGLDRGLLNEVIVSTFLAPAEMNEFLFDNMEQKAVAEDRPFDRFALDAEWDARLLERARERAEDTNDASEPFPANGTLPTVPSR